MRFATSVLIIAIKIENVNTLTMKLLILIVYIYVIHNVKPPHRRLRVCSVSFYVRIFGKILPKSRQKSAGILAYGKDF